MENVAGEALGVNAHQGRRGFYVAHYEGDGFFDAAIPVRAGLPAKAVNAKLAPTGGEIRRSDLLDFVFAHIFIISGGDAPKGLRGTLRK